MKFKIDSGYIIPDPADPYRFMLIAYRAESDSVMILRRAEMVEPGIEPTEDIKDPCHAAAPSSQL